MVGVTSTLAAHVQQLEQLVAEEEEGLLELRRELNQGTMLHVLDPQAGKVFCNSSTRQCAQISHNWDDDRHDEDWGLDGSPLLWTQDDTLPDPELMEARTTFCRCMEKDGQVKAFFEAHPQVAYEVAALYGLTFTPSQ